jgi:hypothetical protein
LKKELIIAIIFPNHASSKSFVSSNDTTTHTAATTTRIVTSILTGMDSPYKKYENIAAKMEFKERIIMTFATCVFNRAKT